LKISLLLLLYRDGLFRQPSGKNRLLAHGTDKVPLDSSQRPPLNDQRHEGDVVPIVPKEGPTAEEARSGGPTRDRGASTTKSHPDVDAATSPDLVLEALARDFAVVLDSERNSSDQHMGMARERSDFSAQAVKPSIRASPRSSGFKNDLFASDRRSFGRQVALALASVCMAALIGVGAMIAWQSNGASTTKSPDVAAEHRGSAPAGSDAAPQPAPSSVFGGAATSSELVQQFDAMARDLAVMRDSVEQLAAKQEQMAQDITTLKAVADKQEQMAQNIATLAAKQEQMAQNIATLQAVEQNMAQNLSSPPLTQAVPLPPRKPIARTSSVPRPGVPSTTLPRAP
jgi:hypothetical protein